MRSPTSLKKQLEKTLEDDNSLHFNADSTNISSVMTKKSPPYEAIHARILEVYSLSQNCYPKIRSIFPPINRAASEHVDISKN